MSTSEVTTDGVHHRRLLGEAASVVRPSGLDRYERKRRGEPVPTSYYGLPVMNKPVWAAPDIPGYLFLGGLAGAGALIGAVSQLTGRRRLARAMKVANAGAVGLSLVALVHDLGRRSRFLNMLRVFKVTSPMSVGSWLLAGFAPATIVSAYCDVTGALQPIGTLATLGAAGLGPGVATYTAALIADTAVPAWHEGHEMMPFVFAASAAASAAGLGLAVAPVPETTPLKLLGCAAGAAEVALTRAMQKKMGMVEEVYRSGKAEKFMKSSEALLLAGSAVTLASGSSRTRRAAGGVCLFVGSALTRFGIFEAGLASAQDPRFTVEPQRERMRQQGTTTRDDEVQRPCGAAGPEGSVSSNGPGSTLPGGLRPGTRPSPPTSRGDK